jgi:Ca-activated chloride channel homolog
MLDFLTNKINFYWLSFDWFHPETLKGFTYENFLFLYGIPAVPLLFVIRWLIHLSFRDKLDFAFPEKDVKTSWISYLRFIPDVIMTCFVICVLIALARPQKTNEKVDQYSEGIDIVLALDISESMQIEDFTPNRLEAAKKVAKSFVAGRLHDRIGLVVFSGEAYSLSPLTTDYNLLQSYIDEIKFELIKKGGTAIGSALAIGINRLRESESKSKVLILLSDGENTAGNISPITAAELGKAFNIKIYTIAVGKDGLVPFGTDPFGNPNMVQNTLDETTLRKIASIGEGRFYRASSNNSLKNIFSYINKYEKAEIKETRYKDTKDYYEVYIMWGILFFIMWLMTKTSFISNALED